MKRLFALIGLVFIMGCGGSYGSGDDSSDTEDTGPKNDFPSADQPTHTAEDAKSMAEILVKNKLDAPIPPEIQSDDHVEAFSDRAYRVTGYADTNDQMGKKVRKDFAVKLHWVSGDQWLCDQIKLTPHKDGQPKP